MSKNTNMKKEALINIIINDLKEVQQLMEAFRGESTVSSAFINLAKTKVRNIEDEVTLLEQEFGDSVGVTQPVEKKRAEKQVVLEEKVTPVVVETKEVKKTEEEPAQEKSMVTAEKSEPAIDIPVKSVEEESPTNAAVDIKKEEPKEQIIEIESKPKGERVKPKKRSVKEGVSTLSDVLQKKRSAINEKISRGETENDLLNSKPVDDVRKAMGINDRFLYQRELFAGNADLFNQTLDQLNRMSSFDDASNFLISNFDWDHESDVPGSFLKIVKRRFL